MTRLPMIPQEWLEADLVGLVFDTDDIGTLRDGYHRLTNWLGYRLIQLTAECHYISRTHMSGLDMQYPV